MQCLWIFPKFALASMFAYKWHYWDSTLNTLEHHFNMPFKFQPLFPCSTDAHFTKESVLLKIWVVQVQSLSCISFAFALHRTTFSCKSDDDFLPMQTMARAETQKWDCGFLAQSVGSYPLALPQAAWLSSFYRKISSVAPPQGTWIKDALLRGQRREKSPAPGGIGTHNLSVMRRELYRCATIVAQEE